MLCAARYSSKESSRGTQGPNGISFSRMMSGCVRSTRRTNRAHARLSGARPSGNWQMAMLALPDTDARLRLEVQLLSGRHVEGFVPRVQVTDRGDAELFGRVIGGCLLAQALVAVVAAPGARETEEELAILLAPEC